MADEFLIPDDELDPGFRDFIAQFLTPVVGPDGRRWWPLGEVSLDTVPAEPPADALLAHALTLEEETHGVEDRIGPDDAEPAPAGLADGTISSPTIGPPGPATRACFIVDPRGRAWPAAERDGHDGGASAEPGASIAEEVRRRQAARLARRDAKAPRPASHRLSRWAHVPIGKLFEEAGNRLAPRAHGILECGHEPIHGSKGGRCVQIDPGAGLWWCRSCRQGGDAVSFVMAVQGCTREEAEAVLFLQYGAPAGHPRRRKRVISVEFP